MSETYKRLSEMFPPEMEATRTKGGTKLTYIPVSEVINRMNSVLGVENWSSEIVDVRRDSIDPDYVVAHVRVTARINDIWITKDGMGGQTIKRTKSGDIVDLGDEFKGATSDAFKKACQMLGVGLYLARKEDALAFEAEMEEIAATAKAMDPEVAAMFDNFMSIRNSLDEDGLNTIRAFWKDWSGGRPVPKKEEFTVEELEALITEATRIMTGGEYVIVDE